MLIRNHQYFAHKNILIRKIVYFDVIALYYYLFFSFSQNFFSIKPFCQNLMI